MTGYDISGRIAMGDGGALNVSVMGAGDTVTWSGLTDGVMNTAATTLTKTGAGTLALAYADASLAHLTVQEGTLAFTSGATLGVNPNNATIIRVNEGATLALAGGTVNLHAQLNGAGTFTIGTADSAEQVSVTNTGNNNFTGRLELLGNGENMNTNGNRVAFGTGGSLGAGTVFIDGKGFHFSAGTTAANMEIGARHGTVQDGSSGAATPPRELFPVPDTGGWSRTSSLPTFLPVRSRTSGEPCPQTLRIITAATRAGTSAMEVHARRGPETRSSETALFWTAMRDPRTHLWPRVIRSITIMRSCSSTPPCRAMPA